MGVPLHIFLQHITCNCHIVFTKISIGYKRNITFYHKSFFLNKFAEHCTCNSPKIVQRKKYIKNLNMKTLNQHCSNVHIFNFIVSVLLLPKQKSYIRKSADWFLLVSLFTTTTYKHWEKHDFFIFASNLTKNRNLNIQTCRCRHQMVSLKTCAGTMHRIYTTGSLMGCSLINSMHSPLLPLHTDCTAFFTYLTAEEY